MSESIQGLTVADWNGDGKLDVAVSFFWTVAVYLGNGNGTFASTLVSSPTPRWVPLLRRRF